MSIIYYWEDAVGAEALLDTYQIAITKLLTGDYASADLEKLRSTTSESPIYSFRLGGTARLLFTTRKIQGRSYLQVLECLETHDYQKSRFLKKGVLKRYLNHSSDEIYFDALTRDDALPNFEKGNGATWKPIGLQYFNREFIELNHDQQHATETSLPAIVLGAAGSGKTCTALSMMHHFVEREIKHPELSDTPKRILYVTKEAMLVHDIQKIWQDLAPADEEGRVDVHMLTYEQILHHILLPHPIKPSEEAPRAFDSWFDTLKAIQLTKEQLFQEFRICSGYTESEYQTLGERQSSCPPHLRAETYRLYTRFLGYCEQQQIIDPIFHSLPGAIPEGYQYDLIVVDEAQNLSLKQQENLARLAKNQALAYCIDPSQNLQDQQAMRVLLENKYWDPITKTGINTVHLRQTYRCSQAVASCVTALMQAKQAVMGKIDKEEEGFLRVDEDTASIGDVRLVKPQDLVEHQAILARAATNHFAVVTQLEFIEEARQRFNTPLVFTVEQIQGLEYHTVVAYKLLSDATSKQVLREIGPELEDLDATMISPNRAKKGAMTHQVHAPWFNSLYTAYTRAQHTLLICEEEQKHKSRNSLRDWLQQNISERKGTASPDTFVQNHPTDWVKERERQVERQNYETAAQIDEFLKNTKPPAVEEPVVTVNNESYALQKKSKRNKTNKPPSPTPNEQKVLDLLGNFTKNGMLTKFFELPQNLINILLFHTPVTFAESEQKHSLFQYIISNSEYANRLAVVIKIKPGIFCDSEFILNAIKYTNDNPLPESIKIFLCSKILCSKKLLKSEQAKTWVSKALEEKPIREKLIISSFEDYSTDTICPFKTFIAYIEVFTQHKKLISDEHLAELLSLNIKPGDNDTALFHLSLLAMTEVYSLKPLLIDTRPDILRFIPPGTWGLAYLPGSGRLSNTSPLSLLCDCEKGRDIIYHLVEKHPDIIRGIPAETWGLPMTEEAQGYENSTPLHTLMSSSVKGMLILETLIDNYPDIISTIPNNAWYLRLTSKSAGRADLSPLTFFVLSKQGVLILDKLLTQCPDVLLSIPREEWHRPFTITNLSKENTTAYKELHDNNASQPFLARLVAAYPDIMISRSIPGYREHNVFANTGRNNVTEEHLDIPIVTKDANLHAP